MKILLALAVAASFFVVLGANAQNSIVSTNPFAPALPKLISVVDGRPLEAQRAETKVLAKGLLLLPEVCTVYAGAKSPVRVGTSPEFVVVKAQQMVLVRVDQKKEGREFQDQKVKLDLSPGVRQTVKRLGTVRW